MKLSIYCFFLVFFVAAALPAFDAYASMELVLGAKLLGVQTWAWLAVAVVMGTFVHVFMRRKNMFVLGEQRQFRYICHWL